MAYVIAQSACINCGRCRHECPTDTIRFFAQAEDKHWIDPVRCIDCDLCLRVCPTDCISREATPVIQSELLTAARDDARVFFATRRSIARSLAAYASGVIASVGATENVIDD